MSNTLSLLEHKTKAFIMCSFNLFFSDIFFFLIKKKKKTLFFLVRNPGSSSGKEPAS